jgi:hypothetical protein
VLSCGAVTPHLFPPYGPTRPLPAAIG